MKASYYGLIALATVSITAVGLKTAGPSGFEIEVHRPIGEVFAAFSDVRSAGSKFRDAGIQVPHIDISRNPDSELAFTTQSWQPGKLSRIAYTFEPGRDGVTTVVHVTVDVPPIPVPPEGKNMVLSDDKVQTHVVEATQALAKDLDQGKTHSASSAKLSEVLDTVALMSFPEKLQEVFARNERVKAEMGHVKQAWEHEGFDVKESNNGFELHGEKKMQIIRPPAPGEPENPAFRDQ